MNTSSMISVSYEKAPVKEIEVDISRSISTTSESRFEYLLAVGLLEHVGLNK